LGERKFGERSGGDGGSHAKQKIRKYTQGEPEVDKLNTGEFRVERKLNRNSKKGRRAFWQLANGKSRRGAQAKGNSAK